MWLLCTIGAAQLREPRAFHKHCQRLCACPALWAPDWAGSIAARLWAKRLGSKAISEMASAFVLRRVVTASAALSEGMGASHEGQGRQSGACMCHVSDLVPDE